MYLIKVKWPESLASYRRHEDWDQSPDHASSGGSMETETPTPAYNNSDTSTISIFQSRRHLFKLTRRE
jgi:hypothetical protein